MSPPHDEGRPEWSGPDDLASDQENESGSQTTPAVRHVDDHALLDLWGLSDFEREFAGAVLFHLAERLRRQRADELARRVSELHHQVVAAIRVARDVDAALHEV